MKNAYVLLVLFLFCIPEDATAQFKYGIKTGLHLGFSIRKSYEFSTNGFTNFGWEKTARHWPSPLLGVYATFELGTHFSLQAELMGLHKTWRSDLGSFSSIEQFEYTYINLPFMLLFHGKRFGVEVGPAFNYLMIRRNISPSKSIPMEPQRLELAINAGFNYYFRQWTLGIRFTNDLTPFFRNYQLTSFNLDQRFANYYHRGYQFSIAHQL